jgi:chaperone modulatory protein CbpM
MISLDDLVAAISALQRGDLEAWIREELVAPRQEAGRAKRANANTARGIPSNR